MSTLPAPTFLGIPIFLDYHASIKHSQVVHTAVMALVRTLEASNARREQVLAAVPLLIAEYGLTARLVGQAGSEIRFVVTSSERRHRPRLTHRNP